MRRIVLAGPGSTLRLQGGGPVTQWRFPDDLVDEERLDALTQLALAAGDFPGLSYQQVWEKLLAGYTVACCKVAKSQKDHWVGRATLRRYVEDAIIDALARRISDNEPGVLHRHGDVCSCLTDHEARWPSYIEFAVHDFLKTNPSAAERSLSTLKKRETAQLRGPALAKWWYACGYCRERPATLNDHVSGRALTLDHPDPYTPGVVVVACKSCNAKKGQRTADEAGMRLHFCPPQPARDWSHALAEGEAAFAEADRLAVPIVLPGHEAPGAPPPTPRPRTQTDPYLRGRVPTRPAEPDPTPGTRPGPDPAPATRSVPGSAPGTDRVPTRVVPGPRAGPAPGAVTGADLGAQPARKPAPEPARDPDTPPVAAPGPQGPGRDGTGNPPASAAGQPSLPASRSKAMRWVLSVLLPDQPMGCYEIARLIFKPEPSDDQVRQVERALYRLLELRQVVKIPSRAPVGVTWIRARPPPPTR